MKRITLYIIFLAMLTALFTQQEPTQEEKKKTVYNTTSLYVYDQTRLLISKADLLGAFYIGPRIERKYSIIGTPNMDSGQSIYGTRDEVFLNVGSKDGVKEGDQYLIIAEGERIKHYKSRQKLGYFYMRKGLAEITCVYEDKSLALLVQSSNPIEIGDHVIPYEPEEIVQDNKINYTRCRIPQTDLKGEIVYICTLTGIVRQVAGPNDLVSTDLGNAYVSKGDFLLLYKILEPDLPPMVIGSAIVVNAQNMSSTVKILDCSQAVEVGIKVLVMPKKEKTGLEMDEKVPIIKTLDQEEENLGDQEESIDREILFDLDAKTMEEQELEPLINEIKDFIESKSSFIIILRGHTCSIGGEEYNLKLSQSRVEFIKALIMKKLGIEDKFIESYFYGEKEAPYDNTTEEQRQKNRLVSIQIIGK